MPDQKKCFEYDVYHNLFYELRFEGQVPLTPENPIDFQSSYKSLDKKQGYRVGCSLRSTPRKH